MFSKNQTYFLRIKFLLENCVLIFGYLKNKSTSIKIFEIPFTDFPK